MTRSICLAERRSSSGQSNDSIANDAEEEEGDDNDDEEDADWGESRAGADGEDARKSGSVKIIELRAECPHALRK